MTCWRRPIAVAFARLAVFAGGADLAAVERVVIADWPADGGPAPDALDAVASLLDKSLLRQEMAEADEPRFRMLESIRAFGLERLDEREPAFETRRRHADYYLAMAEEQSAKVFGAEQRAALDALEHEHDNLRAAIGFAIDQADAGSGHAPADRDLALLADARLPARGARQGQPDPAARRARRRRCG